MSFLRRDGPSDDELERLDYLRSLEVLGPPPGDLPSLLEAGVAGELELDPRDLPDAGDPPPAPAPGGAGAKPPPYLETPPALTSTLPPGRPTTPYQRLTVVGRDPGKHARRVSALRTLRAASQYATGVQIMDPKGSGYPEPCGVDGFTQRREFANDVTERRFVVDHCGERDRCPICSTSYGEAQGDELGALLATLAAGATDRRESDPFAWRLEVTVPRAVSDLLAERIDAHDVAGSRWVVDRACRITEQTAWWAFSRGVDGAGRIRRRTELERSSMLMALNVHTFHSRNPLSGELHLHVHATIPNVTAIDTGDRTDSGRILRAPGPVLRHRGFLDRRLLEGARRYMQRRIVATFGELVDLAGYARGNWHVKGIYSPAALLKRAHYVNRSPWHDVAKREEHDPSAVYGDAGMRSLALFTNRQAFVQSELRVRRYRGAIAPGSRKRAGIRPEVPDELPPRWVNEAGGYRRIERYDADRVYLRVYGIRETIEAWDPSSVVWGGTGPPRRFTWTT